MAKLILENFQGFAGRQAVEISRFNLVFGPNSSGKTSITRALKLLKKSLHEKRNLQLYFESEVESVELVYGKRDSKKLGVGISFESHPAFAALFGMQQFEFVMFKDRTTLRLFLGNPSEDEWANWVELELFGNSFGEAEIEPGVISPIEDQYREILENHFRKYGKNIAAKNKEYKSSIDHEPQSDWDNGQSLLTELFSEVFLDEPAEDFILYEGFEDSKGRYWRYNFEEGFWVSSDETEVLDPKIIGNNQENEEFRKELSHAVDSMRSVQIDRAWDYSLEQEESWLQSRPEPEDDWGEFSDETEFFFGDEFGFRILVTSIRWSVLGTLIKDALKAPLFLYFLEFGEPTRVAASEWSVTSNALDNDVLARVNKNLLVLTDGRFELVQEFQTLFGSRFLIQAIRDNLTGVTLSFNNVGDGLKQVLPILLQFESTVAVMQQPELHLHPKMQANLADLFTSAEKRPQILFMETHSENILLRFQKLIRTGQLPKQDLSIIFCESDGVSANSMVNLELDNAGDVIDPFPISFADLRLQELL